MSYVSLTRRAHKPDKTGTPSKMHPRINTRAHLSVGQTKASLRGHHLGSVDRLEAHLSLADFHRTAYASPGWFHLGSSHKDPPLEGYIRMRRDPHSTHHQHVALHSNGEALPGLVLRVGGG